MFVERMNDMKRKFNKKPEEIELRLAGMRVRR